MDDQSGDTIQVDDMMFDEADHVGDFNFSEQDSFCPLREVISYRKDEP